MADYALTITDDELGLLLTALSDAWIIQPRDAAAPSAADALFYKLHDSKPQADESERPSGT